MNRVRILILAAALIGLASRASADLVVCAFAAAYGIGSVEESRGSPGASAYLLADHLEEESGHYYIGTEAAARAGDPLNPPPGPLLGVYSRVYAENLNGLQQGIRSIARAEARFTDSFVISPSADIGGYTLRIFRFGSGMPSPNIASVPEPSGLAMLAGGAIGVPAWRRHLAGRRRTRRHRHSS